MVPLSGCCAEQGEGDAEKHDGEGPGSFWWEHQSASGSILALHILLAVIVEAGCDAPAPQSH